MLPNLAGLIGALRDRDVRFVAIGGIAVAAHQVIRATEDLDLVPDPAVENIDALANTLASLDARLVRDAERGIDSEVRRALHRGRNLTVTTSLGDVDIVQRLPGVPAFATLDADAWEAAVLGVPFRVCSRAHLIAMKQARGSALDRADLERLLEPRE
jgi:hypothetical protein